MPSSTMVPSWMTTILFAFQIVDNHVPQSQTFDPASVGQALLVQSSSTLICTHCFIQKQNGRILQHSPRNGNTMLLTSRELNSSLFHLDVVTLWKCTNKIVCICYHGTGVHLLLHCTLMPIQNILIYCSGKQSLVEK